MIPRPDIYFRIMLMMVGQQTAVTALSILDVLSAGGPKLIINTAAQVGGYAFTNLLDKSVLVPKTMDVISYLPPIVSKVPETVTFFNQVSGVRRTQRVAATLGFFASSGLAATSEDVILNINLGGFLFLLTKYIAAVAESGSGGPTPYIGCASVTGVRKLSQFTRKEHIQCQLAIAVIGCLVVGYTWLLYHCVRNPEKVIQKPTTLVKRSFKRLKLKKRMQKISFVKRQSAMVEFIPIH